MSIVNVEKKMDFEIDDRDTDPDASRYRLARFRIGWDRAVRGDNYSEETLRKLTWDNLGWRLGRLLGEASQENVDRVYRLCVRLQAEQGLGGDRDAGSDPLVES